ncbi:MAG: substrate-binding domain-containing protein [Nitrospirae bacterium]|nr:substrate-binding domain-containing protein [Nitrospirota bacterium]
MKALSSFGLSIFVLVIALDVALSGTAVASADEMIRCASTTSTQNSGFFDYILPIFQKKTGIKIEVVAVGTGAAIEIGKRGDVDFVFVHAKDQELKAVAEGWFVNRKDVMYNDFVLLGDAQDPAGVKGVKSAVDAFKKIAHKEAPFVSRGDKSGTHTKELFIWQSAGIEPKGRLWYMEAGQGMEKTQRVADEHKAYTLTDRGTWLAKKEKLDLQIMVEGDPILFNQYGIMAVNPEKYKHAKYKEAMEFINWLISKEGQEAIAAYKDKNGNSLFIPNAK